MALPVSRLELGSREEDATIIASRLIIVSRCWLSHGHRGAGSPGGSGVRERHPGLCPDVPQCHRGAAGVGWGFCDAPGPLPSSSPCDFPQDTKPRPPPRSPLTLYPSFPSWVPISIPLPTLALHHPPGPPPASPPYRGLTSPLSLPEAGMREEHFGALRGQIKTLYLSSW